MMRPDYLIPAAVVAAIYTLYALTPAYSIPLLGVASYAGAAICGIYGICIVGREWKRGLFYLVLAFLFLLAEPSGNIYTPAEVDALNAATAAASP